jgi:transcriptional regulator with XRE-family HTH domain
LEVTPKGQHVFLNMLTPSQVRAARGLLGWSRSRLAKESDVPYGTITDYENSRTRMLSDSMSKLVLALDAAGVELLLNGQDGKGSGVRFKKPETVFRLKKKVKEAEPESE